LNRNLTAFLQFMPIYSHIITFSVSGNIRVIIITILILEVIQTVEVFNFFDDKIVENKNFSN